MASLLCQRSYYPITRNSLSDHCKDVELLSTFRRMLKSELFNIVYQEHNA